MAEKKVLIAEMREIIRAGLCAIFQDDPFVADVANAATREELKKHISSHDFDLIIVNQALVMDIQSLPQGKFALLVDKPDLHSLRRAYEHNALGYFSVNIATELLKATLNAAKNSFLVDPVLLPWIMEHLYETRKRENELRLLSPREREIMILLDEGLDRRTIARRLHISEATLKTHIKNIARKHEDKQWSQNVLVYQRYIKRV